MTPSTAIQRPDLGLALLEFNLAASQKGMIAQRVFPVLDVGLAAANFERVTLKELLQSPNLNRAAGARYEEIQTQFTQDNYTTQEYGIEAPVDDNEMNIYAYTGVDAELVAAMRARDAILRALEVRVAAKLFDTTRWTGGTFTSAVSTQWSNRASCTPIDDVDAGVKQVYNNFGIRPNALVISWPDYKNLRQSQQIIDRIKYTDRDDATGIGPNLLAQAFDIEEVIVGDAVKNTANSGQNASISPVWGNGKASLVVKATSSDLREPCVGRIFNYVGDGGSINGTFEEYRDERRRGTVIRCRQQTGERILNTECGFLLTNLS